VDINKINKITLSIQEASILSGLSVSYLYKLSSNGELPVCKIGTRVLILRSELEAFLRAKIRGNAFSSKG